MRLGRGAHRRAPARARYRRLVRGSAGYRSPAAKQKAIVAVAHTLIVIIWHVLATGTALPGSRRRLLHHPHRPGRRKTPRLVAKLEALGHKVTLEPAA